MSNTKFNCRECGLEQEFELPTKFLFWDIGGSRLEIMCVPSMKWEDGYVSPARKMKMNLCVDPECFTELPHLNDKELDSWLRCAPENEETFDFHKLDYSSP